VLDHWSSNPQIEMSSHSDTLSWFRPTQSLLFLLNSACLAKKQQIPKINQINLIRFYCISGLMVRMLSSSTVDRVFDPWSGQTKVYKMGICCFLAKHAELRRKSKGTTDHGQATGKLYHLRLRVECTLFCNLQSRARTHAVLVIGLYELLGNPTT
jgi:hypothetical protein